MKNNFHTIVIILFSLIQSIPAQTNDQKLSKCACAECHQFDFWIGDWKAKWINKDGSISEGKNIVTSILNSCVIEENFEGSPEMNFRGKSFSVYNQTLKCGNRPGLIQKDFICYLLVECKKIE